MVHHKTHTKLQKTGSNREIEEQQQKEDIHKTDDRSKSFISNHIRYKWIKLSY